MLYDGRASPCPENPGRLCFLETMGYTLHVKVRNIIVSYNSDRLDDLTPPGDGPDASIYSLLDSNFSFSEMEGAIKYSSTALAAKVLQCPMEPTFISLT